MGDKSKIEWTDATWNPVVGCSVAAPGCKNCYAMRMAGRLEAMNVAHYEGTTRKTRAGAVWTGKVVLAPDSILNQPLRWKKPRLIFVNSMGDLFHENVPLSWIDRVFAIMTRCPQHTFQVLTKQVDRMRDYLVGAPPTAWPLPNVWLGVSVEDQRRADLRVPALLDTPAAVRFVSCEPLLGPVDLRDIDVPHKYSVDGINALAGVGMEQNGNAFFQTTHPALDWVIAGGESGRGARPMQAEWVRRLRDQCAEAGVAFLFKQWGPDKKAGRVLDGVLHDQYPAVVSGSGYSPLLTGEARP